MTAVLLVASTNRFETALHTLTKLDALLTGYQPTLPFCRDLLPAEHCSYGLSRFEIVLRAAPTCQDSVDWIACFKKNTLVVQFKRVVKKTNAKSSSFSVVVKDTANADQDITIRLVDRRDTSKCLARRKLQPDKSNLFIAKVLIIKTYISGK